MAVGGFEMETYFKKIWWVVALYGLFSMLFALCMVFYWPRVNYSTLIVLFGIYAMVGGIIAITSVLVKRKGNKGWWLILLSGLLSVAIGYLTIVWVGITPILLLLLFASYTLVMTTTDITVMFQLRRGKTKKRILILSAILSAIVSIFLLTYIAGGARVIISLFTWYKTLPGLLKTVFVLYTFIFGLLRIMFSLEFWASLRHSRVIA
ncbi:DUF308 domain-containing protein [bacterium]|nr:DUF308 domain-containing protein [bacterium]